jgi:hypothetical protein
VIDVFVVPALNVRIESGSAEDDPHRQGFAGAVAEATIDDVAMLDALARAKGSRDVVTLRCAMLDVSGTVSRLERAPNGTTVHVAIDDVVYRRPRRPPLD